MIHWQIKFNTFSNDTLVVNIYDDEWNGEIVQLLGGASPFETQEDSSDDPFIPIRTQSGYIRVINKGDIDGVMGVTATDRYVTLTDDKKNVLWQGFIQPEQFSQAWDRTPYEVEFPVVSMLSILETKEMDASLGFGTFTLRQLISEALVQCGIADKFSGFFFDKITSDVTGILAWKVSRFNWFKQSDSNADDPNRKEYQGATYRQLLEDIFSFIGMTLHERKNILHAKAQDSWSEAGSKEASNISRITMSDFISQTGRWTSIRHLPASFETKIIPAGASHKQHLNLGRRKVTVTGNINPIGEIMEPIAPAEYDKIGVKTVERNQWLTIDAKPTYWYSRLLLRKGEKEFSHLTLHTFDSRFWTDESPYPTVATTDFYGAIIADADVYTQDDINNGKKNFSYNSGIFVHGVAERDYGQAETYSSVDWNSNHAFSLKSAERARYDNGYIVLDSDIQPYDSLFVGTYNGLGYLIFGLKVGDKYWDGHAWQSYPCTFYIKYGAEGAEHYYDPGSASFFDLKTLDMDCNGASGYIIPVNTELSGDVELRFYNRWIYTPGPNPESETIWSQPTYLCFKSLDVKYWSPDSVATNTRNNNVYSELTNKAFPDAESISLAMASWNHNKEGYGIIKSGGQNVEEIIYYYNGSANWFRPEEYLLRRRVDFYNHATRYLSIECQQDNSFDVQKKIADQNGKLYALLSESVNWRDEKAVYQLVELN